MMAPYKGTKVVTYHRSYPNFAERFGLDVIGYVEPRPGIPPTPQHTLDLINEMKRQNVKLVLVEPYFDLKTPNAIGTRDRRAGARDAAVGWRRSRTVTDYFKLFDYDINLLVERDQAERARSRARWTSTMLEFLAAPFVASLILDRHPRVSRRARRRARRDLRRPVAGADCRARRDDRAAAADLRRRPARAGRLLGQPGVHLHRRVRVLDDSQPARADSAGGDHRHLLRGRVGGGDSGDEQGDLGERASQGHARRQHPRRVVAGGAARRRSSTARSALFHYIFRDKFLAISMDPRRRRSDGVSIRFWDFLFYASFGFVVTSSVAIAGVLLVFCYLIVPSVAAMLYADRIGKRLAIGWSMGTHRVGARRVFVAACSTCRPARRSSAPSAGADHRVTARPLLSHPVRSSSAHCSMQMS